MPNRAFDEMYGHAGAREVRDAYAPIAAWLAESPLEVMTTRRRQAELFFRRIGITFAVYGDPDAAERLIPFDIVPRILGRAEWTAMEAGLIQRVAALNAFLADIYGPQDILRAGIVPEELVLRNPGFNLAMVGKRPVGDVWVHISPASTSCGPTPMTSTCSRTMHGLRRACRTCSRTAR